MKGKIVFLSTALAGLLGAASAAHAASDVKVFPGNACQAQDGTEAADFFHESNGVLLDARVERNRSVVCPIVRDNHKNLNGVKVGVRVRSPNATTLTCDLESYTALGDFVASNTNSTISNLAINLPLHVNTSTKGGTYSLFCNLPPGGQVLGYQVTEF